MATIARIRRIGIIALVTGIAIVGDGHVRSCKRINGIVVESRWRPGCFAVTSSAIRWELSSCVVRCRGCRIIGVVATVAGIGCIRVVAVVTSIAIVGDGHVCTYELIHCIVVER